MIPFFQQGAFQTTANMTPDQIERKRAYIAAMMPRFGSAKYVGEGLGQLATGVVIGRQNKKLDGAEDAGRQSATAMFDRLFGTANSAQSPDVQGPLSVLGVTPAAPPPSADPGYVLGVDALPQNETTPGGYSMGKEVPQYIPEEVKNGIFAGESGGDYNALFGFSNREGGQFGNVKLTDMTVDQAIAFSDPSGPYGQWVKGQVGRVATPMGAYQIVGTTLRGAKEALGLTGNERMTPELQDRLGGYIYETQGTGAWEGYRGPQQSYTPAQGGSAAPSGYSVPQSSGIPMAELQAAMMNPWLMSDPAMAGVIQAEYQRQQQMADPMYQLQLQQAQLELQKAQNPEAAAPEAYTERAYLAQAAGLEPGTPAYQEYLLTGKLPEAPEPGYQTMTPEEVAQLGLPPGAYQRGADGKISQIGGGGTNISVNTGGGPDLGKLSTDYGYVLDPNTGQPKIDPATGLPMAAPVPGSPAAIEAEAAKNKAALADSNAMTATEVVTSAASRAREANKERAVGGFLGGIAALNPSSYNAEVYRQVDVLKSNATIENLTAMREASPTGGALGSVTQQENAMLAAKAGALDPASPNFERDLDDYERTLLRIVHGKEAGDAIFEATRESGGGSASTDADGWTTLPNGVKVRVKQ